MFAVVNTMINIASRPADDWLGLQRFCSPLSICGARSVARGLARKALHVQGFPEIRRNLPCLERHAALPGKHDLIRVPIKNLPASVRQRLLGVADARGVAEVEGIWEARGDPAAPKATET